MRFYKAYLKKKQEFCTKKFGDKPEKVKYLKDQLNRLDLQPVCHASWFNHSFVPGVILALILMITIVNWAIGQENDNVLFDGAHGNIKYKPGNCTPNKNPLKGSFKISIKYSHTIGDTLFYKLHFDELYGLMDQAAMRITGSSELYTIMKVVGHEVHLQSILGNLDSSVPLFDRGHFFDFDAKVGERWEIHSGMLYHGNVKVTSLGQMKLGDDTLYDFSVEGDHATSHVLYMKRFLISKGNGFAAFVWETESPEILGYYFSAKYRKYRKEICEYLGK